ncbi:non-ribosomal peptide synthetase [Paenibacillus daejeonensis]|uniref:non-ribosomal peptide synthetase n=1 Tax=Paenibacillus daejeonensis TaxID=135193 RepID=UPI00037EB3A2|nr:non-ribosomal peptide synthetase [Paenibacillus daejeonensis]
MCTSADRPAAYPLTHPQKRIMYVEQMHPDLPLHVVGCVSTIHGAVDFARLERAIRRLVATHDAFRLRFMEVEGELLQLQLSTVNPFRIPLIDLSGNEAADLALEHHAAQESRQPLPFTGDTLFRFTMFRLDGERSAYMYTMHHLITDGWSVNQLSWQIAQFYVNDDEAIAPSPGSYLSLLEREQRYAESPRAERDRQFWMKQFAALPEPLFPNAGSDLQGQRYTFVLEPAISSAIRHYTDQQNLSIYSFFTALTLIWLYRNHGNTDVTIGVPVYNRTSRQEKEMLGVYTSLMPLRAQVEGHETAAAFLQRMQSWLQSCYAHQKYPYDLLAQHLELRRQGMQGLFQVTVNVYNTRLCQQLGDWQVNNRELYSGCQLHPLELVVQDWSDDGSFTVDLRYQTAIYPSEQIEVMAGMLQELLHGVLLQDSLHLDKLPLVSRSQQHQLLHEFKAAWSPDTDRRTVHSLLEEQALYRPDQQALICGDRSLTYRQLNEQANRLAHLLRSQGVGPDRTVAIIANRTPGLIVGIYGILKAGGAYVPIDPTHPLERLRHVLEDSGAKVMLSTGETRKDAEALAAVTAGQLALIDLKEAEGEMLPSSNPTSASGPNDLAYVIYTSGSTGRPKGVMVEHRSVVNFIEAMAEALPWPDQPEVLCVTTVSFDIFVTETLLPLARGMRVIMADERQQMESEQLQSLIRDSGVNVIQLTPSRMMLLLEGHESSDFLGGVEIILLGGEALPPLLLSQLQKRSKARIFNMYGPTETTVWSTLQEVSKADTVTVGRPLRNTQVLILDKLGELLPIGIVGELCIAGDGLARGYRNRTDLTVEQFIYHPLSENGRLYRTGDLARWRGDGTIEHLGRIDRQMKIHGHRIEPGEIEHCLMGHEAVRMAAVVDAADAFGVHHLYAFYTSSGPLDSGELRTYAAQWLPSYMIPAVCSELPELPLTTSGKVDRKMLGAMALAESRRAAREIETSGSSAPGAAMPAAQDGSGGEAEKLARTIAACLSSLLPGAPLGLDDDFFRHGGHSLHVLRAVSLMKEREIPARPSDLYAEPTPLGLAGLLRKRHGAFTFQAPGAADDPSARANPRSAIRVISSVSANKDAYTWEEINCFTKPMAILFEALSPGSYELFLFHVQFGLTFFPDDWRQDLFERSAEPHSEFFEMYGKLLHDVFHMDMERHTFTNESEMRESLIHAIDQGHPVLIPGDLFGLFYSNHYLSEPHTHYFIVKGYDAKRGLLYILDNMQNDEGARPIYTDFVMRFTDLYEMSRYYADHWCAEGTMPHFWELSKQGESMVTPLDSLSYHREQLERWQRGEFSLRFIEQEMAREVESRGDAARIMNVIPLTNYKKVYYDLLFRLLEQAGCSRAAIEELRRQSGQLRQDWESLRLKLFDQIGDEQYQFAGLQAEMDAGVDAEYAFFGEVLAVLRQVSKPAAAGTAGAQQVQGVGGMSVYNPNGAQLEVAEACIRIVHTEERTDDTWIVKDEAPQLLLIPASQSFFFEARLHSRNKYGPCFHSGIIVKFNDFSKVMFGCARRKLLGVFYPEHTDNYEWYARPEVHDVHYLRVEAETSGILRFLARHEEEEPWELLCERPAPAAVRRIGIFSKTWEPTNHTAEFSQLKYREHALPEKTLQAASVAKGENSNAH